MNRKNTIERKKEREREGEIKREWHGDKFFRFFWCCSIMMPGRKWMGKRSQSWSFCSANRDFKIGISEVFVGFNAQIIHTFKKKHPFRGRFTTAKSAHSDPPWPSMTAKSRIGPRVSRKSNVVTKIRSSFFKLPRNVATSGPLPEKNLTDKKKYSDSFFPLATVRVWRVEWALTSIKRNTEKT